jgi:hypothetical protein
MGGDMTKTEGVMTKTEGAPDRFSANHLLVKLTSRAFLFSTAWIAIAFRAVVSSPGAPWTGDALVIAGIITALYILGDKIIDAIAAAVGNAKINVDIRPGSPQIRQPPAETEWSAVSTWSPSQIRQPPAETVGSAVSTWRPSKPKGDPDRPASSLSEPKGDPDRPVASPAGRMSDEGLARFGEIVDEIRGEKGGESYDGCASGGGVPHEKGGRIL